MQEARAGALGLAVGALRFNIGSDIPDLVRRIAYLYADHPIARDGFFDFSVTLRRTGFFAGRVAFAEAGRQPFLPLPREHAFPMLEWGMNWCVATAMNCWLILHAAVLAKADRAVVLPGRPGAGKSTLAAVLMLRGWRLLSDEHAIIDVDTGALVASPRPVSLKNESIGQMRALYPDAPMSEPVQNTHKGTIAHLRPTRLSVEQALVPARARWIILPEFARDRRITTLTEFGRGEALIRLAENAFNYNLHGVAGFEALADAVRDCDAYELPYASVTDAADMIDALPA